MPAFELHGEISADGASVVLIASGDPHELAKAARALTLCTPLMRNVEGVLCFPLTWMGVAQLAWTYGPTWKPGPRLHAWIADELTRRVTYLDKPFKYAWPEGRTPYWWQLDNAKMIAHLGGLITDDPGAGKSCSAILGLCERAEWGQSTWPAIVVCPPSVVDSWVREWQAWAPHLRVTAWRGAPPKRAELIGHYDVYVTGYSLVRNDAGPGKALRDSPLMRIKPVSVIADEIHFLANTHAIQTAATRRLGNSAQIFIPMSGTPFTHDFSNLQPTLDTMLPGACPSKERLVNRWCLSVPGDYGSQVCGLDPAREPELRMALLGQVMRHAKADVLPDLPAKVYSVREVDIPPRYRKIYNDMERRMLAELEDGTELSVMSVLAKINRLALLSCAAADVDTEVVVDPTTGEEREHQHVRLRMPSWKVDALLEVLDERLGRIPVLAFAPSRQLMMLAGQAAADAGARVGYIVGQQTPAERTAAVDAFQAGELDLMCATTAAGGTGLTLTAAGTVVFLANPLSLVERLQSEDRAHRISSIHESIEIIDIYANKTIDKRFREILFAKAGQLGEFLGDPRLVKTLFGGEEVPVAA